VKTNEQMCGRKEKKNEKQENRKAEIDLSNPDICRLIEA
jgi:hypothetical protein